MPSKKKKKPGPSASAIDKRATKECTKMSNLLVKEKHVEAITAAKVFLGEFENDLKVSCFLLTIQGGIADWENGFLALRERLKTSFRMLIDTGPKDKNDIAGLFNDWTFLFYGLFNGEDILQLTTNYWKHPEDEDDNDSSSDSEENYISKPRHAKKARQSIKIGYMSSSFFNTALCQLFCGVPQSHNKETCTIVGLDTWKDAADDPPPTEMDNFLTKMVKDGCDEYHRIGNKSNKDLAKFIKNQNLDVLVALDGIMSNNRLDILSYKVAPVVCTVLGYPCTTGCPDVNYFIADDNVIRDRSSSSEKYSERIAYMPVSCYVGSHARVYPHLSFIHRAETENGEKFVISSPYEIPSVFKIQRGIKKCWEFLQEKKESGETKLFGHKVYDGSFDTYPRIFNKSNQGLTLTARFHYRLPEKATIFTTFNAVWKIDPELFQIWMNILRRVPNAILWIKNSKPVDVVEANIRAAAGSDLQDRIVFAKHVVPEEHVRRGALADVHLDTRQYNGHTTSLDALWTGSVILAIPGQDFHNRVTCTLLHSLNLPCLCCTSEEEYEETVVLFGLEHAFISHLQEKLQYRKLRSVIFDTKQFAADMEDLCREMMKCYNLNPDKPSKWNDVEAEADGEAIVNCFESIDLESLKEFVATIRPVAGFPAPPGYVDPSLSSASTLSSHGSSVVPPPYSPLSPPPISPGPSLPPVSPGHQPPISPALSTPQAGVSAAFRASGFSKTRIELRFQQPLTMHIISKELYLGQRCVNVACIESACYHLFQRMEMNYDSLYIGPIMAAQFVDWFTKYFEVGIPQFPKKKEDYHSFFESRGTFRNLNFQQFIWMSGMFDTNGNVIERPNPEPTLSKAKRRTDKTKCFQCSIYDHVPALVGTLLEKHVPAMHTWGGINKAFECCSTCGVPLELFLTPCAARHHCTSAHNPIVPCLEEYLSSDNDQDGRMEDLYVYFIVNLTGDDVLSRELRRYNAAASDSEWNRSFHYEKKWLYQRGQKMVTFLWLKEAILRAVSWMKENIHKVAASGGVGFQFLRLVELNLFNPFCPRFQNLGMMSEDERKTNACAAMKYDYKSSYENMCKIFGSTGLVEDEGGQWRARELFKDNSTLCKLCGCEMKGGAKNVHQQMKLDHVVVRDGPPCELCNFSFGNHHIGQDVGELRQSHSESHAKLSSWEERILDGQGQEDVPIRYEITFNN